MTSEFKSHNPSVALYETSRVTYVVNFQCNHTIRHYMLYTVDLVTTSKNLGYLHVYGNMFCFVLKSGDYKFIALNMPPSDKPWELDVI